MKAELTDREKEAVEILRNLDINPVEGLPEELFLLISGLVPLPNVDLFILNAKGEILLTRRNDEYFQKSWHIPGGTMRYRDSFEKRIQETALRELGTKVTFDKDPISIRNVLREYNETVEHKRERGHNVAILYKCYLPDDYEIDNGNLSPNDNGYLKWFDELPEDFMRIQYIYEDVLKQYGFMRRRCNAAK